MTTPPPLGDRLKGMLEPAQIMKWAMSREFHFDCLSIITPKIFFSSSCVLRRLLLHSVFEKRMPSITCIPSIQYPIHSERRQREFVSYLSKNSHYISPCFPLRHTTLYRTRIPLTSSTDYIRVCAEAVFKKGEIFAPILQIDRLRDEAFGRFWVEFSSTYPRA